ncbi:helix-turn-helix transcriptional regulator [Bacillus gobiensis]|uniref:helix-turn-helix domain-containing protein n=1 Tax=Bacillus gobiensis TaxID=1441095 RepID=UPI003D2638EB
MTTKTNGEIIESIRVSKGITATYMAKKLGYKSVSSYRRLENGESAITLDKAKVIADVLSVNLNDFFNHKLRITRKEKPA